MVGLIRTVKGLDRLHRRALYLCERYGVTALRREGDATVFSNSYGIARMHDAASALIVSSDS